MCDDQKDPVNQLKCLIEKHFPLKTINLFLDLYQKGSSSIQGFWILTRISKEHDKIQIRDAFDRVFKPHPEALESLLYISSKRIQLYSKFSDLPDQFLPVRSFAELWDAKPPWRGAPSFSISHPKCVQKSVAIGKEEWICYLASRSSNAPNFLDQKHKVPNRGPYTIWSEAKSKSTCLLMLQSIYDVDTNTTREILFEPYEGGIPDISTRYTIANLLTEFSKDGKPFQPDEIKRSMSTSTSLLDDLIHDIIVKKNIKLVIFDFDQTLVAYHTGGMRLSDKEEMEDVISKVSSDALAMIFRLKKKGIHVGVATFSSVPDQIHQILQRAMHRKGYGTELASDIFIVGRTKTNLYNFQDYNVRKGKNPLIQVIKKYFARESGHRISKHQILLIDDDLNNVRFAISNKMHGWHVIRGDLGFRYDNYKEIK